MTENLFLTPNLEMRRLPSAPRTKKEVVVGRPETDNLSANRIELSNRVADSLKRKQHSN